MNPKAWMDYMLDHTVVVAEDDPELEGFVAMEMLVVVIQLRVIPASRSRTFCRIFLQ
jgi:hypothetical protein